jgi:phosphomevalonate kinase
MTATAKPATVDKQRFEDARTQHIFAICYVEQFRSLMQLRTMRENQQRKNAWRETPTTHALWMGCCALEDSTFDMLKKAKNMSGHLLFCWEGSSIVEFYDRKKVAA